MTLAGKIWIVGSLLAAGLLLSFLPAPPKKEATYLQIIWRAGFEIAEFEEGARTVGTSKGLLRDTRTVAVHSWWHPDRYLALEYCDGLCYDRRSGSKSVSVLECHSRGGCRHIANVSRFLH